uniref:Alkylglycerol monooxygenase n=1 Tax=Panagrellus redivivus TaxID=6233 RepID=A0A7E4VZ95_PANRE
MNESDVNATLSYFDSVFTPTSFAYRLYYRLDLTNLRHIFYLISPNETITENLDDVPNYNIEVSAWWMALIFLEFIVCRVSGHEDRYSLNDSITSICAGMLSQCFKFGGRTIAIFAYVFIWNNFRINELPWDSPWTWIFCLIFQDFMYYLGHRAVHEAGFFWGLHTIHHSSEYYNLSTALRQAAIQDLGLALYDVIQAFWIPPPIFLVHRYFSEIFQFWLHTSLLGDLKPLGYVLNSPSYHRVHHGRNPYCIDRNYGGVLIIWDKMFKTFAAERPDDPPIYGLVTNERNFNQVWLQFHTLKELLFDKWRMKNEKGEAIFNSFTEKVKAVFYPPGYFPGLETKQFFHWRSLVDPAAGVPEPEKPADKYDPPLEVWKKLYCTGHFILLLCAFMHFEYDRLDLSWLDFTLKIAFFVCTMQMFGAFFDRRWFAPLIEIFRCGGVIIYIVVKMFDELGVKPNRLFLVTVFSVCAIFWMGYVIERTVGGHFKLSGAIFPTSACANPGSKEVPTPIEKAPQICVVSSNVFAQEKE